MTGVRLITEDFRTPLEMACNSRETNRQPEWDRTVVAPISERGQSSGSLPSGPAVTSGHMPWRNGYLCQV